MQLKIVFIVFLFFNTFFSIGQESFFGSDKIEKKPDEIHFKTLSLPDSTFVVLDYSKSVKNKLWYYQLDTNATILEHKEIELPCDVILDAFSSSNGIKISGQSFNKEKNEDQLYFFTINSKGDLTNSLLLLKSSPNGGYHTSFQISQSPDFKSYAILTEKPYQKESKEEITLSTFNEQLELISSKDFIYTFPSLKRKVNIPVITNKKNVYVIKRIRIKRKNNYYLVNLSSSGVITHGPIKLRSKPIADMSYELTDKGELVLGGFYSSPVQFNFEGVFLKKYNNSINAEFSKEYPLPSYIIESFKSKKEISKTGYGLNRFHCKSLTKYNSIYYLTAEHITSEKKEEVLIEKRDGIVCIGFTEKGDFKFASTVLTKQTDEKHKGYFNSSFSYYDNGFKVLFNEIGHLDKKANNNFGENVLYGTRIASINENGQTSIQPLVNFIRSNDKIAMVNKSNERFNNRIILRFENAENTSLYFAVSNRLKMK